MDLACEFFPERELFHGFVPRVMGTKFDFISVGTEAAGAELLWNRMCAEASRLDAMLNRFDPSSELSALNSSSDAGETAVSAELAALITEAERYRELTGGLFDIARGSCGEGSVLCGQGRADLRGGNLDFGGFAKGYFLSRCRRMLSEAGVGTAYLDFGGSSIYAAGHHPFGDSWKVSLPHPFGGAPLASFDLVDLSLSVSGNQPGYSGHICDPRTMQAVTVRRVCAVTAADPLDAEVASTAAMVGGRDSIAFLKKNLDISELRLFEP